MLICLCSAVGWLGWRMLCVCIVAALDLRCRVLLDNDTRRMDRISRVAESEITLGQLL